MRKQRQRIGWIQGRNGLYDVTQFVVRRSKLAETNDAVYFGAIGYRGTEINGGVCVKRADAVNAMKDFLREQGYLVVPTLTMPAARPDYSDLTHSITLALGVDLDSPALDHVEKNLTPDQK